MPGCRASRSFAFFCRWWRLSFYASANWGNMHRTLRFLGRPIKLLFQERRRSAQTRDDLLGPTDIFESSLHRPVRWRTAGDCAQIARLVSQLDPFGIIAFLVRGFDLNAFPVVLLELF